MSRVSRPSLRALVRLPAGVVRAVLVVRVVDEWWSYLPAGAIGDLRRDLGVSYAQAGWLLALLTIGGLVGSPLVALADRGYRRLLSAGGCALLAGGLLVYASGAPFVLLALASTVMGGASDLMIQPLETSLAELHPEGLDRLLGRQHLVTWCGDLLGPAVLALGAATWLGWRGAFAVTAAVIAAYGVLLAFVEHPTPAPPADDEPSLWHDAWRLARSRDVMLLAGAELLMIPLDEAFLGFAVARLTERHIGASAQALAVTLVIGGVTGAAMVGRLGLRPPLVRGAAAALVAGAVVAAAPPWPAVQAAGMLAFGFGTAVAWARVHHRALSLEPGRSGTVSTVVGVLATPAVLVPAGVGWLADRTSLTVALVACAALAVPLAVIVLALGDRSGGSRCG